MCITCDREIIVVSNAKPSDECARCRAERIFEPQMDQNLDDEHLCQVVAANATSDALKTLAAIN